ncbi:MAG: DNA primase [Varibaculum sp.]|nr:DNA primase [Varibaculum sp.]
MAGIIKREDIERVRELARIDDVVSEFVALKTAGLGSKKGLCPFHDEKTPSFNVNVNSGYFHCFGCGEGGDVFAFIEKINHVDFVGSVEYLAAKYGVELHYDTSREGQERAQQSSIRSRITEANRIAEQFFIDSLQQPFAQPGRNFLAERGFDEEAIRHFGIGYSPPGWDNLLRLLRGRGFDERELAVSGLLTQGKRGLYDRFRNRLIWPIRDLAGTVIGFGARQMGGEEGAKYLNTPETPLYKKSKALYGIDLAKKAIVAKRQVVIVEGYTDVMAAHLAGIETAVATCGTAFGEGHVGIIRRLLGDNPDIAAGVQLSSGTSIGGSIIFTFDGDAAGQKAALRAFKTDQSFAAQTFVAVDRGGEDPCEIRMHRGDEAVKALIDSRIPLFKFVIENALTNVDISTAEGRIAGLRAAAPVIRQIRDLALRREYTRELAGRLGLPEDDVYREVGVDRAMIRVPVDTRGGSNSGRYQRPDSRPGEYRRGGSQARRSASLSSPATGAASGSQASRSRVQAAERQLLAVLLQFPSELVGTAFDELGADSFQDPDMRAVHDVVRSLGGVAHYGQLWQQARILGGGTPSEQAALDNWLAEIREAGGDLLDPVVTALAAMPLPLDSPEKRTSYANGLLNSLLQLDLTRQIADLESRSRAMDHESQEYLDTTQQLMALQARRRSLRR